jgi:hypothetical protein
LGLFVFSVSLMWGFLLVFSVRSGWGEEDVPGRQQSPVDN